MTALASAKGFRTTAAFKTEATFGTPVACGALDGFEYNHESIKADVQLIKDDQVAGVSTLLPADIGNSFFRGDFNMDARYEGFTRLVAMVMGDANGGSAPGQVGADNAYRHVLKILDDHEAEFGTLAFWLRNMDVREFVSTKLNTLELSCKPGDRLKATFGAIAQALNVNTGAGTNTTASMASVTFPANRSFPNFGQMKCMINATGGAGLSLGSNAVYLSDFKIKVDNGFTQDDVTTKFGTLIDEPVKDKFTMVSGTLGFSKYQANNTQLFLDQIQKNLNKMIVQWTGPAIGGTFFTITLYLPAIKFKDGTPNVPGAKRVPLTLNFEAYRQTAIPTGFPAGYTNSLTIEMINQVNTNAISGTSI